MGVNVHICKYTSGGMIDVSKEVDFDTFRHAGDSDFARCGLFGLDQLDDELCHKVDNPAIVRAWVNENIQAEGNRNRLLNIIDKMERDRALAFYFSW